MRLARTSVWRGLLTGWLLVVLLTATWPARAQTKRAPRRARTTQSKPATNESARTQPVRVPQLAPAAAQPTGTTTQPSSTTTTQQPTQPAQQPTATPTPQQPRQAQPPADAIDEDEVVRVTSNLVVVPASVTTADGAPVQGLKATDFRLEEEGRAQEIAQVGDAEQVPLDIALLFDVSSSVSQKNFFAFQQQAAASFLKQVLKPVDRAAVVTIADTPRLVVGLSSAEEASTKMLAIPAASSPVPTAFYDAISFAAKYLAKNSPGRNRHVIVVISDGDDNFSERVRELTVAEARAQQQADANGSTRTPAGRAAARRDLDARHRRAVADVQREVQRADAVFYSINPGGPSVRLNEISTRAQTGMEQVAVATGGTAYVPENADALPTVFRQIANELRAQYLLQYYSNSNAPNGKYLNIKVAVPTRTDLRVRARQGYYVKKG